MPASNGSLKISIIMPAYNRAGYIAESIESVQKQTYQNWELIIIDDVSDDDTENVVAQIKDERIRFFKAGRIGVGGRVKNIGIEKSTGELIAFIDSDDLWAATKLEKQVTALQQYPGAGFSLTGGYNFRNLQEPVDFFYKQKEGIKYDNVFISIFKSEIAAFAQALLLRKECLAVTGLFKEIKSFSDVDFIVSLACHFKAVILYEPLVFRCLHDMNYITPNWEKSYYEGIEIIQANKKLLPRSVARGAFFRLYIDFGEKYLLNKKKGKAISNFFNAWRNRPFSIVPLKKTGKTILSYFKK